MIKINIIKIPPQATLKKIVEVCGKAFLLIVWGVGISFALITFTLIASERLAKLIY